METSETPQDERDRRGRRRNIVGVLWVVGLVFGLCGCGGGGAWEDAPVRYPSLVRDSAHIPGADEPAAWWVWHRTGAPQAEEMAVWREQGVGSLFWHLADFAPSPDGGGSGGWRWRPLAQPEARQEIDMVPVVRIHPHASFFEQVVGEDQGRRFFGGSDGDGLAAWRGFPEVQFDFDCPTRLLEEYAGFVRQVRGRVWEWAPEQRVSVTALAGWIDAEGLAALAAEVDALFPMFYDLDADRAEDVRSGRWLPFADAAVHGRWIRKWAACPVPWVAGLPNFARVSVFGEEGGLRGHLRSWQWDELVFHPDLRVDEDAVPAPGVLALRVERSGSLAGVEIAAGDRVVVRRPDLGVLRDLQGQAVAAGARGVCWFRLPGRGGPDAWSVSQIVRGGDPELELIRQDDGRLRLGNRGDGDLPPRFKGRDGTGDRGWKLEIDVSEAGGFAGASPGEFVRMAAHAEPEVEGAARVHPTEARRLTFWFSHLPAGEEILTGVIALTNIDGETRIRWRVDHDEWSFLP